MEDVESPADIIEARNSLGAIVDYRYTEMVMETFVTTHIFRHIGWWCRIDFRVICGRNCF